MKGKHAWNHVRTCFTLYIEAIVIASWRESKLALKLVIATEQKQFGKSIDKPLKLRESILFIFSFTGIKKKTISKGPAEVTFYAFKELVVEVLQAKGVDFSQSITWRQTQRKLFAWKASHMLWSRSTKIFAWKLYVKLYILSKAS